MVSLTGYICMFVGAVLYSGCFKSSEIRQTMAFACFINLFGAVTSLMFVNGVMLGMSPFVFICFTSSASEVLYSAFVSLPAMVVFAKMIPATIESSMFAITTGLQNFANLFAAKQLGNIVNMFIGVK